MLTLDSAETCSLQPLIGAGHFTTSSSSMTNSFRNKICFHGMHCVVLDQFEKFIDTIYGYANKREGNTGDVSAVHCYNNATPEIQRSSCITTQLHQTETPKIETRIAPSDLTNTHLSRKEKKKRPKNCRFDQCYVGTAEICKPWWKWCGTQAGQFERLSLDRWPQAHRKTPKQWCLRVRLWWHQLCNWSHRCHKR